MAVLDPVVGRLGPGGIARQPTRLAQCGEPEPPAGHDLVDVGLVAGVPEDGVARGVEDPVQGEGQLDDAEVGAEVAAGERHRLDDEAPDLAGEDLELVGIQEPEVGRTVDRVEEQVLVSGH